MDLKEKYKLLLDEELIDQREYDLLMSNMADDTEKKDVQANEEEVKADGEEVKEEVKGEEVKAKDDFHDNIDGDKADEGVEEIKAEAKTETLEEEEQESAQEQASEENALLKRIEELEAQVKTNGANLNEISEVKKTNEALAQRVAVLEDLITKLSVKADEEEEKDFGASGNGQSVNGGEPSVDKSKGLWHALGGR